MVRVPLEELVLQIHLLRLGKAYAFLQRVLEPPPAKSVEGALAQLQSVGALSKEEVLTPLGMESAFLCHVFACILACGPCCFAQGWSSSTCA